MFMESIEDVDRGIHHIMEISGTLMQNMGEHISGHISTTLLPIYAQTLLKEDKKDYEIVNSVCFICDCMEHGNIALFDQIQK